MTLAYAAMRSGAGRPHGKARVVRDVETVDCPDRDGPHWLTNDADGRTCCAHCGESWAALDQQSRA